MNTTTTTTTNKTVAGNSKIIEMRDSMDARMLRWSGVGMIAFLAAAFVAG